jgi:hypothetical protein
MSAPTASPPKKKTLDLVGLREIATLLEVNPRTPTIWRSRSAKGEMHPPMPEPDGFISNNRPVWEKRTILKWAKATDRLPNQRKAAVAAGKATGGGE